MNGTKPNQNGNIFGEKKQEKETEETNKKVAKPAKDIVARKRHKRDTK